MLNYFLKFIIINNGSFGTRINSTLLCELKTLKQLCRIKKDIYRTINSIYERTNNRKTATETDILEFIEINEQNNKKVRTTNTLRLR